MKRKPFVTNPYLPLDEYIPDGEPRLFNGRLYIYGSHDRAGGNFFCLDDYVTWSAPEEDLTNWRYEGIIYKRTQDPSNASGALELFAPDVVEGKDGRYYLYYCLRMLEEFGVAVSNSPTGPFEFYGHVHHKDGSIFSSHMPYDPSVLVDDNGKVYLYYGFSSQILSEKFHTELSPGAMVVELESDMLTICSQSKVCIPWEGLAKGTSFENHAYFEAPSIRKYNQIYYLIYSSQWCRELCYATSKYPDHDFIYSGVLVDNADIGIDNRTLPAYIPGNNHGSIIKIKNQFYIFYHRHTHATSFSRQGCAEKIYMNKDGTFLQAKLTSCGLNKGSLLAIGTYSATIASHLYGKDPNLFLDFRNVNLKTIPYITQDTYTDSTSLQYITNIQDGTVIGYRYFKGVGAKTLSVYIRGQAKGRMTFHLDNPTNPVFISNYITLTDTINWQVISFPFELFNEHSIYICYEGEGFFDFSTFIFS